MGARRLLTINTGSSSLKAALYRLREGATEALELRAEASRIGGRGGGLRLADARGETLEERRDDLPDQAAALDALLGRLRARGLDRDDVLAAVGHRIVHGGDRYSEPQKLAPGVVADLRSLVPLDPNHLPQAIKAIEAVAHAYPAVPQVVCFDTAFHGRMPRVARLYALPRDLVEGGVVRYGFHGLSYEYVMDELCRVDREAYDGRVVVAHLGNGASMAAVKEGVGVDTTMGFTPTGGLVMGTRSGDLDPGVALFLLEERGLTPTEVADLVNKRAGLLGVSGTSSDMRELLDREADDPRAAEAVELFCYQAKKFLGALAAALGGLDALVFTGGIGQHSATVRGRICEGLGFLGVRLDPEANASHAPVISGDDAAVTVRVVPTDEDLMVARHTRKLIEQER
ncbi:MAG: Acetate kinase [uncultured Rubrobacteraceae bacterium]|uniref:Acetate kinase n=1 Tax=uncultured Rubrobacteraceae bacterium TaxID=349277 RepID=A0A6J4S8H5_9ACTN|nr:MAG: Acetate kinase [uncultured Rubrobacteraceae bacterium]